MSSPTCHFILLSICPSFLPCILPSVHPPRHPSSLTQTHLLSYYSLNAFSLFLLPRILFPAIPTWLTCSLPLFGLYSNVISPRELSLTIHGCNWKGDGRGFWSVVFCFLIWVLVALLCSACSYSVSCKLWLVHFSCCVLYFSRNLKINTHIPHLTLFLTLLYFSSWPFLITTWHCLIFLFALSVTPMPHVNFMRPGTWYRFLLYTKCLAPHLTRRGK